MEPAFTNLASSISPTTIDHPNLGEIVLQEVEFDSPALMAFYAKHYKPGHPLTDKALFSWQFENNNKRVVVLVKDGSIIAHQGHIPCVFTDGANDYRGFVSANVMVDPEYRRNGLMTYLLKAVKDRYDMGSHMGASEMGVHFYEARGYHNYEYLERMVGIVDIDKSALVSKQLVEHQQQVRILDRFEHVENGVSEIADFSSISDEELTKVRDELFTPGSYLSIKRDTAFLHWRYDKHPYFTYQKYGLWEDDTLKAVIVFRKEHVTEANTSLIRIVEFFGNADAMKRLARSTLLHTDTVSDVAWIDWSCSYSGVQTVLRDLGFRTLAELQHIEIPLLCSPIDYYKVQYRYMCWFADERLKDTYSDVAHWYITKGDGDADRPNTI